MNNDYAIPTPQTAYEDGNEDMTPLLKEVLDAHGGLTQWKNFTKISATIRSGGDLWEMKGVPQDPSAPANVRIAGQGVVVCVSIRLSRQPD